MCGYPQAQCRSVTAATARTRSVVTVTRGVSVHASCRRLNLENPGWLWEATTPFDLAQKSTLYPKDFYSRNLQSENTKAGGTSAEAGGGAEACATLSRDNATKVTCKFTAQENSP